jgi:uncharacterized protein (DUF488 family)
MGSGKKLPAGDEGNSVADGTQGEEEAEIRILTMGHGTRELEEFLGILRKKKIQRVIDVRSVPRSRHNPQYNLERLSAALASSGIGYTHMASLGGFRKPLKDSPNGGWRSESFRGFADYMLTPEYANAVKEVSGLSRREILLLLCAETIPWRCHRSLIADSLTMDGHTVEEILGQSHGKIHSQVHRMTPLARVREGRLLYPPSSLGDESLP